MLPLVLAGLALLLQTTAPTTPTTPTTPQRVIVAIGDSMTAGFGVAAEASYPAQLESELKKRGYAYRVINQGVTASTTTQAVGRLTRALATQASIAIIQLGGNDASAGIPASVSRDNLKLMIRRFKPGGAKVYLAGGRFSYLDELAREEGVEVIPFLEGVAGKRDLLLPDGVHPNADGYKIVVANILRAFETASVLKK